MRLKDIAAIVAATQGHELELIHTRMRNQAFKALLSPKPGGPESAHPSYSRKELCRAMILIALSRMRLTVDDLAEVNRTLGQPPRYYGKPPEWAKSDDGTEMYPDALGCIIEGARRDAGWTLRITVLSEPKSDHALKTVLRVQAFPTDNPPDETDHGARVVALQRKAKGQIELGRVILDASELVKPLLDDEV